MTLKKSSRSLTHVYFALAPFHICNHWPFRTSTAIYICTFVIGCTISHPKIVNICTNCIARTNDVCSYVSCDQTFAPMPSVQASFYCGLDWSDAITECKGKCPSGEDPGVCLCMLFKVLVYSGVLVCSLFLGVVGSRAWLCVVVCNILLICCVC